MVARRRPSTGRKVEERVCRGRMEVVEMARVPGRRAALCTRATTTTTAGPRTSRLVGRGSKHFNDPN